MLNKKTCIGEFHSWLPQIKVMATKYVVIHKHITLLESGYQSYSTIQQQQKIFKVKESVYLYCESYGIMFMILSD